MKLEEAISILKIHQEWRLGGEGEIINIITGDVFSTIKEVLPLVNLKRTTFQAMLNNQNPNKTNFKYYE